MSKKYIIGIDGGSQSTKVVMYDLEGSVVCEGKGLLQPMHTPYADTAEHPDDDLWASLCFAGHDLMSQFAGNKEDIVGIGLGSIRCCRALLKADGTPAAPSSDISHHKPHWRHISRQDCRLFVPPVINR